MHMNQLFKTSVLVILTIFIAMPSCWAGSDSLLVNKRGIPILPTAKDWSIGINANPFFTYLGNMFNGNNANSSPQIQFLNNDFVLTGKYFLSTQTAIRAKLRLGYNWTSTRDLIDTNTTGFGGPIYIEDITYQKQTNISFGAGIEKRKGWNRLQGYYGGELLFSYFSNNSETDYEVPLGEGFTNAGLPRVIEQKMGNKLGFTIRGFIGVEYFVAPKISIGGELGWGLGYSFAGYGETVTERWGLQTNTSTEPSVLIETQKTPKSVNFGMDTDNSGGNIQLNFYF